MAYTIKRIAWALVIALFVLLAFMMFPGVPDRGDTGKGAMKTVAKDNVDGRRGEAVNSNGNLAAEGIRATEVFAAIGEHMDSVTKTLGVELHEALLKAAEELRHQAETEALTREAAARFEQLSGKPQIVWGKVFVPGATDLRTPLRMSLGLPAGSKTHRVVLDGQMRFAFPAIDPGTYEVILYETDRTPGIRLENVKVERSQSLNEIDLSAGSVIVKVCVQDEKEKGLAGVAVTVGKSGGGQNGSLITYKRGLSDPDGMFTAQGLVDGDYVVSANLAGEMATTSVSLAPNEYTVVDLIIRTSGAQLRGVVREGSDGGSIEGSLVRLEGGGSGEGFIQKTTRSGVGGEFVFNMLPKGVYEVSVPSTRAYSGCITQVSVESEFGSPSEAVLALYRSDECGEVTGRIEGATAIEAGEMLAVRAVNDHGLTHAYAVVPVADEFSLKMIPPGRYQIVASTINRMGRPLRSVAEVTSIVSPNTVVDVKLLFK